MRVELNGEVLKDVGKSFAVGIVALCSILIVIYGVIEICGVVEIGIKINEWTVEKWGWMLPEVIMICLAGLAIFGIISSYIIGFGEKLREFRTKKKAQAFESIAYVRPYFIERCQE